MKVYMYFMKLLDVNEYAVTKLAKLKHLVLKTAGIWPFMSYILYVSTAEMFI